MRVSALLLGGLLGLLGQKDGLDVGQHAALGDGHSAQQLVELLVVADGQLQVAGNDAGLLVVAGGVSGQFQDLRGQVLQHRRQVDWRSGADALSVVPLAEESVDATHGELEPGAGGAGLGLRPGFASGLTSSRHVRLVFVKKIKVTPSWSHAGLYEHPGLCSLASPHVKTMDQ